MTSQISTTDTQRKSGTLPFFRFTLKQSWTLILLFAIILFFVFPIFTLMGISESQSRSYYDIQDLREELVDSWLPMMRVALTLIGCVFSIVVSCKHFGYMKNKVATDFFHSMPQRRGQLYLNRLAVSACSVIIPYAFNLLLTCAIIGVNGLFTAELLSGMAKMLLDVFVYSTFCLAITTLVGMVTGLTSVTLSLTAVALIIIPASIAVIVAFLAIFSENMWIDYYLSEDLIKNTSPAIRFFIDSSQLDGFEVGTMLLVSVVMLIGAYFIYVKRKNERAGTPVVFTPLGEVIKYILVFLATLLLGLLFFYIMDESFVWTVFGMICGAVLTFMLTNTILNKTAKAMFKGAKGLGIYAIVMVVGMIVLMSNLFGVNTTVPKASAVRKVMINFDGEYDGFQFTDKAAIEAVANIYNNGRTYAVPDDRKYYDYSYRYGGVISDSVGIEVVFYPNFGIPIAKRITVYNRYDLINDFRTILNSEQFAKQYVSQIENSLKSYDGYLSLELPQYIPGENNRRVWYSYVNYHLNYSDERYNSIIYENGTKLTPEDYAVNEFIADAADADFDYFQSALMGKLRITDYSKYGTITVPLRESATEVQNRLITAGMISQTAEEANARFTELIDNIKIYDLSALDLSVTDSLDEAPLMTVTDKAQIRAILDASTGIMSGFEADSSPFIFNEKDYLISVDINVTDMQSHTTDTKLAEEDIQRISEENNGNVYRLEHHTVNMRFRLGMTPDFVSNYFN